MALSILKGKTVDVHLWTPITEVESQALDQLRNIASLPWVFSHVAAMPDVHFGIGATVGSVIAMRSAICPAAVGVDIGCFTRDTEVPLLDGKNYKISELADRGEFGVYAFSVAENKVVAAKATARLTRKNANLVSITLDNGEKIRCTPDHQFLLLDGSYREAKDLTPKTSLMPLYKTSTKEGYTNIYQPYSKGWQRAHWIVARSGLLGAIPSFEGQRTIIHHKNFDEADNSTENLQFMGDGDHSRYHRSLVERNTHWQSPEFEEARVAALKAKALTEEGHTYFAERGTKNIVKYMEENPAHYKAAIAENGQRGKEYLQNYNTSEKGRSKSKEVANRTYKCEICGVEIKSPAAYFGSHLPKCRRNAKNHKVVKVELISDVEDVYCLVVPTYNNFALKAGVFVHNCGMAAVKTNLRADDLPDDLKELRHSIERGIPVGFNDHRDPLKIVERLPLWKEFDTLTDRVHSLKSKAMRQCGSLGGGNHFLEMCLDTDSNVWLMLHSGSRNIGKVLAEHHIAKAKKLAHNVEIPDRDLSVFLAGTPEMRQYRNDLFWAQQYAFENRRAMLKIFQDQVKRSMPQAEFEDPILCHHNYVAEETHFGEEVFVTRKGAIRAGKGDLGIIPGSMGTCSYVVRGLGNPDSFESASHGAGRLMSRGEAKRRFTKKDLEEQTAGVECRKDEGVIDEIPGAYKPIDQVMNNQKDLVEVVAQLKQVMCIKG